MLFNTIAFGLFFVVVLTVYHLLSHRTQNYFLLLASYAFYACWDYRFIALILISTTVDYWIGQLLFHATSPHRRKRLLLVSILFNLGFLGFFKYYNFFAANLQDLLATLGLHADLRVLSIVLPVGISFYTFQSLSYTLDIYRKELHPAARFSDFALSVAFFPHMVAGPIQRARSLIDQIEKPRLVSETVFARGIYLILWGLFKKVVLADNLGMTVDRIFASAAPYSSTDVVVGMIAFAFQIYGDFSGYSDMARGIARLMGFNLMNNFNLPYFARNPQDFWRRWHISLSTWLRDYLYIPLGGNRGTPSRIYFNLMLTMILGGLWHGAAWTFILWGAYHGALLCAHRWTQSSAVSNENPRWHWIAIAGMFCLTSYGWLIFRAGSCEQLAAMNKALWHFQYSNTMLIGLAKVASYAWPLILMEWIQYRKNDLFVLERFPAIGQAAAFLLMFYAIVILGAFNAQSFIYFQF